MDQSWSSIAVVVRHFQASAGRIRPWNPQIFDGFVRSISGFLGATQELVSRVIIVSNGDQQSPLGEAIDGSGKTPTVHAIEGAFSSEVSSCRIVPVVNTSWGRNAGSASALNTGWQAADDGSASLVLSWNPDFHLSGSMLACGLDHMRRYHLDICGFYRKRWYERYQWQLFQNTATIYSIDLLRECGGFSDRVDGGANETVAVGDTAVNLMGMDDFYFYLTACRQRGRCLPWGMYGVMEPSEWEVVFADPEKQRLFDEKVLRQLVVMQAWAREVFPDLSFGRLMDLIFSELRQG